MNAIESRSVFLGGKFSFNSGEKLNLRHRGQRLLFVCNQLMIWPIWINLSMSQLPGRLGIFMSSMTESQLYSAGIFKNSLFIDIYFINYVNSYC